MRALAAYENCRLCGRKCGTNRTGGEKGFCGSSPRLRIAWAGIHHGEEPAVAGEGGSGAVFLSGCTLKCFFCQNYQLSSESLGRDVEIRDFEDICLMLQRRGAENINLVTGTQFTPSLAEGIKNARSRNLRLPVIWNSSGYDEAESIPILDEFVDIYLPDLKTVSPELGAGLFGAPGYAHAAQAAVKKMAASHPLRYKKSGGGVLASGVIVRHLVLPGLMENTQDVLKWFAEELAGKALLSLMFQYTPAGKKPAGLARGDWERGVSAAEYEETMALLDKLNIEDGFAQELPEPAARNSLPDFSRRNAFPKSLAEPYWFCGDFQ